MEDWQERVFDEQNELRKSIFKLKEFVRSSEFHTLEEADQELLKQQTTAMGLYLASLQERIDRF